MKFFSLLDRGIDWFSSKMLVLGIASMLILTLMNIVLRWCNLALMWVDPTVRHLVFLCTFLGGVIATGRGTHVGIDIIGKYLENVGKHHWQINIHRFICLVCTGTLIWLIKASISFLLVEIQYGKAQFLGIHSSILVSIIPFGFILIAYRFFFKFLDSFSAKVGE